VGWKSTTDISRSYAIDLIKQRVDEATNDELGNAVEALGYGDDPKLELYGYNFNVSNEDAERKEYERLKRKFEN